MRFTGRLLKQRRVFQDSVELVEDQLFELVGGEAVAVAVFAAVALAAEANVVAVAAGFALGCGADVALAAAAAPDQACEQVVGLI